MKRELLSFILMVSIALSCTNEKKPMKENSQVGYGQVLGQREEIEEKEVPEEVGMVPVVDEIEDGWTLDYFMGNVYRGGDTLRIASHDDFLEYPFGAFENPDRVYSSPLFRPTKRIHRNIENPPNSASNRYRFGISDNGLYAKFIEWVDSVNWYLGPGVYCVGLELYSDRATLLHQIKIGMSKERFFEKIAYASDDSVRRFSLKDSSSYFNVVDLSHSIYVTQHYIYTFKADTLSSIVLNNEGSNFLEGVRMFPD